MRMMALRSLWISAAVFSPVHAQDALAPIEARVPFAPASFVGSDGATHLAYELHITNFYGDTGPLKPEGLKVFADHADTPLLDLSAEQLAAWVRPSPEERTPVSIPPGKRVVVFVWLTLPAGSVVPHSLRHRMTLETDKKGPVVLDGAPVDVDLANAMVLGPPLRSGRWLAHEGPGASQSHHWGSLVAVNGQLTIPQRYAIDLVGVDARGRAMSDKVADIHRSHHADWLGYGAEVIAVADGEVVRTRNDQPEHTPLEPQPEPVALTTDGLFGNYVVLKIGSDVFAGYAHLQPGSVAVKPGDHVRKGQLLGRLGQSGNSAAPHLHFQLANAATFEGSEGVPYVFDRFDLLGPETEAQLFGIGDAWKASARAPRYSQLPLNDVVVEFGK
jgi:murein DD-endopeptidase MepM/ murein hydrolase activator NlpD